MKFSKKDTTWHAEFAAQNLLMYDSLVENRSEGVKMIKLGK